jgi:hypothetical protein
MTELKTKENKASVKGFISKVNKKKKRDDCLIILKIMEEISKQKAKMWGNSIVGFGRYHYKYASGREGDWPKIGFSPRKQNLTIYIMDGFSRYDKLMKKLGRHSHSKSCLYIDKLEDVDLAVLRKLIRESYKYMSKKSQ